MELRIGETIAAARRAKDMTQQMLAEAVGVSIAAVSKWETSASYPDITLLPPIARTLGLTLNELFRFHEAPTREMLTAESERLSAVFEQQGFAAGQAACETLLHQYPSCGALKSVIGALYFRFLGAALLEQPDNASSFSQQIYCEILSLLEAAEQQSDDLSGSALRPHAPGICFDGTAQMGCSQEASGYVPQAVDRPGTGLSHTLSGAGRVG